MPVSPFKNPELTPARAVDSDQGYWLGHVGQGVEDASLMHGAHQAEFQRLIADGQLTPAGERYVYAVHQRLKLYKRSPHGTE